MSWGLVSGGWRGLQTGCAKFFACGFDEGFSFALYPISLLADVTLLGF